MSAGARWSAAAAVALLVVLGMVLDHERPEETPTTVGTGPGGYKALHDLLAELGFPVARTDDGGGGLPADGTAWWLRPGAALVAAGAPADESLGTSRARLRAWVEAGGTAVVFLPPGHGAVRLLDAADLLGRHGGGCGEGPRTVQGSLPPRPRRLPGCPFVFDGAGDWEVQAEVAERPFVLARPLGAGRLVTVADGTFLLNHMLEHDDAAPFAVDLARAFGAPHFPELPAGSGGHPSTLGYLARSPAVGLFAGLALIGLLLAWHGAVVPPRTLADRDGPSPALDAFVDSLARLYAGTRDHAQVLARYRELTAARLRHHLGLPRDTPIARLDERLRGRRRASPEALAVLAGDMPVASETELRVRARELDRLVREVTG